ncbi:MAG: AAA family ATPase [Clostridiales bacterium]|nr:AAA family ATPase [Clostridiales bacterium]MBP3809843.1 AAA family ATPase [Clostridiales bacterium]
MLFYHYYLQDKDFKSRKGRDRDSDLDSVRHFRGIDNKFSESEIDAMNAEFKNDYQRDKKYVIAITKCMEYSLELCAAVSVDSVDKSDFDEKIAAAFPDMEIITRREITVKDFKREIDNSNFYGTGKLMSILNLDFRASVFDPYPFDLNEDLVDVTKMSKKQCVQRAEEILASKSFREEIDRIYSKSNAREYHGHPVHYMISAGDLGAVDDISTLLINALYSNNRLLSCRRAVIKDFQRGILRDQRYRQVIDACEGGVVMIELKGNESMGNFATDFHEFTKLTGDILSNRKKDTLFIFVELTGQSMKDGDAISNITSKADIIQISEGTGTYEDAKSYLRGLTSRVDFDVEDESEAFKYLPKRDSYTVTDIFNAYNAWYGNGLKNHVYKAYKTKESYKVEVTTIESKPYERLQRMVGLTEIKAVVDQIIAAGKVRCVRERMGLDITGSSLNMIFTGTPGTAKTSVARLIAQILKDEEVIKSGKYIECGRQDLVGKYVGWTAKIVEEKFRAAEGGVLFIDEAYSLVDSSNTYGAEAINTITQLMENYRDRVIVIFAGYPDKMKTFLDQNEGLRSRIAFHLNFPDYNASELTSILKLMIEDRQYRVDDEALEFCRGIFEVASQAENFGNGRYVRNVLERAIMRQAERVVAECAGSAITEDDVTKLRKEDFCMIPTGQKATVKLGFAV